MINKEFFNVTVKVTFKNKWSINSSFFIVNNYHIVVTLVNQQKKSDIYIFIQVLFIFLFKLQLVRDYE